MLADNALTTLDRMKLMLGLADIEDERTDEIITLLIIDRIRLPRSIK